MPRRLNCWEYKRCGRQPGGSRVAQLGVCPAASDASQHGVNGGHRSGRACWAIPGTLCLGYVQHSVATKLAVCQGCDFYWHVRREEGPHFQHQAEDQPPKK